MSAHTPTPWNLEQLYKTDGDLTVSANLGTWNKPFIGTIAKVSSSYGSMDAGECYENAKHIVKAVNMHDELVSTLEELLDEYGNTRNPFIATKAYELINKAKGL